METVVPSSPPLKSRLLVYRPMIELVALEVAIVLRALPRASQLVNWLRFLEVKWTNSSIISHPVKIANFRNMHCIIDDLATLHTFETQFHGGLRYLDTLDETLEPPDLFTFTIINQCLQESLLEKCFCCSFASA